MSLLHFELLAEFFPVHIAGVVDIAIVENLIYLLDLNPYTKFSKGVYKLEIAEDSLVMDIDL